MTNRSGNRRWIRNESITATFGLGIGLLLLLMVTVSVTGVLVIHMVRSANESIQRSTEIQRLVLAMDRGMEKARRLHGDFFLQYPVVGLTPAHEQYAQPSVRQIARVIEDSYSLKKLIESSPGFERFQARRTELNLYLSSAKRFADTSIESVELVTELAAPEWGLEPKLEKQVSELERDVAHRSDLAADYIRLKSFVQDYRIARKRFLMQSAFNAAFVLRQKIRVDPDLDEPSVGRINTRLDRFIDTAEKILMIDVAIKAKFNDFALQAKAVNPVSMALILLSNETVKQARDRIDHALHAAIVIMGIISLSGLILAVGIARFLNNGITRRVVRLTRSAEAFQEGQPVDFEAESGGDELSLLSRTFESMAGRIRDLIDNLEQRVSVRTSELAASERRFRQLFEHSSSGVAIYAPVDDGADFIFKDVNNAVETIEGIPRQDMIGRRVSDVFPGVEEFGLLDVMRTVLKSGKSANHPVSYYSDGRLSGWRENSVYKLPSGEIVAVYNDLTAQKQAEFEKEAMAGKLQRSQKMEAIGLMAGGVAHDLNNILSGIVGYPELLLLQIPADSQLRPQIEAIRESGKRAAAVVADLLTVARGVASVKIPADLNRLITEYLASPEHLQLLARHELVRCDTAIDRQLGPIYCSPVHIKKCVMNLVANAMEAMDAPGQVVLATRHQSVEANQAAAHGIAPGDYVVLDVTDTGTGISDRDLEHIFEPFYTKKMMGQSGTGLGLAVVWNTVVDHSGMVLVDSGPGGTAFHLYFPALQANDMPGQPDTEAPVPEGTGETILVVDDEPQQLDVSRRMLESLGYQVACVDSGEQAVSYLEENRVDLILLDMIMTPGISGRETYTRILASNPNQKAVIMSGYSGSEDVDAVRDQGARGFILKPFTIKELARAIHAALSPRA